MTDARDQLAALIGDYPWPSSWDRETHSAIADAIIAAGWRPPLEREPDLPYPFGWSEDIDTCQRRGHQLTHADRRRSVPCWSCRRRKQEAHCRHENKAARYAGFLGLRYYCAACGVRMPDDA